MIELLVLGIYVSTAFSVVIWKIGVLKYREPASKALGARLDALESNTVNVSKEDWETLKHEVSVLKMANGLRTRK